MFLIIGSLVTITCFYFMVAPFYTGEVELLSGGKVTDSEMSVELIYKAVNEAEMDFLMKKISEKDFLQMKDRYQVMAAEYLQMERTKVEEAKMNVKDQDTLDQEILEELKKIRVQRGV